MMNINHIYSLKNRLLFAFGFLGVIGSAFAQRIEFEGQVPESSRVCFVALGGVREDLLDNLYYRSIGEYLPVHVSFAQRGLHLPFEPGSTFSLCRKVKLENGEIEMRPIFDPIPVPKKSDSYLVFIVQVRDELIARIFDDSLDLHPVGHVRFHNFSSNELRGSVNGEVVVIPPYQTALLPFDAKEHTHLNVDFRAEDADGVWRPSYQRSSQMIANKRINIVAVNRPSENERRNHVLLTFRFLEHVPPGI